MIIIMARIIAERERSILVEPYGTYEDWYEDPNEDLHKWISKSKIITINDEQLAYPEDFSQFVNKGVLEIAMPNALGESLL